MRLLNLKSKNNYFNNKNAKINKFMLVSDINDTKKYLSLF